MENKNPPLSIIITSYTMERFNDICDLFDSIKAQTILKHSVVDIPQLEVASPESEALSPRSTRRTQSTQQTQRTRPILEVIFVAERCRELFDRVKEYEERIGLQEFNILFNEGEPGLSAARNLGIKKARGDIIAFVDDDIVLFPNWAEEMVKTYTDDSIIGVTGSASPLWEDKPIKWLPEEFYWLISCSDWTGWDKITVSRSAWGGNMSFKKEAFSSAGLFLNTLGYHKLMAEDLEFSLRVKSKTGKQILYNPQARVWHKVHQYRLSWKFIAARSHHIGVSRRLLKKLYPKDSNLFALEITLSKRILKLLLKILREAPKNPLATWHKLSVIILALTFVTLSYYFSRPSTQMFENVS